MARANSGKAAPGAIPAKSLASVICLACAEAAHLDPDRSHRLTALVSKGDPRALDGSRSVAADMFLDQLQFGHGGDGVPDPDRREQVHLVGSVQDHVVF